MGRRVWVAAATAIVTLGSLVVATPAGAVTASFDATCVTQSGSVVVATEHRTIAYEVHAPDSVAPGTTFDVPLRFGYAVPSTAQVGGAFVDVTGTSTVLLDAAPGSSEVTGTVRPTALGGVGSVVEVRLQRLAAFAVTGGHAIGEICTPTHTLVLARVGVGVPVVSIGDGAIVEGASGTRGLQLAVTLSRPATTAVSVPFTVEDGTATAGSDFTTQTGTASLPAGFVSGIATVRVRGDSVLEPKENFRVRLHDPVGAVLGRAVGTGRIIDDDPERGPRISIGDASVVEGNRAVRSMRFVVSLSEPATQPVFFHYRTVDGTAVAGDADYRAQESEYFIPAGHSSITVPVPVPPDLTPEAAKSFTVQLSAPGTGTGATIGRAKGVGTIIDDD